MTIMSISEHSTYGFSLEFRCHGWSWKVLIPTLQRFHKYNSFTWHVHSGNVTHDFTWYYKIMHIHYKCTVTQCHVPNHITSHTQHHTVWRCLYNIYPIYSLYRVSYYTIISSIINTWLITGYRISGKSPWLTSYFRFKSLTHIIFQV